MFNLTTFAEAMGSVGAGVDAQYDRAQVEQVFGLTGGELEKHPLCFKGPGAITGNELDYAWLYHYEGVPSWAEGDFKNEGHYSHDYDGSFYLTLVETGASYGSSAPDEFTLQNGERWFKVRSYTHSGETECPLGSCGGNETVGEDSTEGMQKCPLCEEDKGEEHGCIYVGPGVETVYRRIDFACAECADLQSEARGEGECLCESPFPYCPNCGTAELVDCADSYCEKLHCAGCGETSFVQPDL